MEKLPPPRVWVKNFGESMMSMVSTHEPTAGVEKEIPQIGDGD